MNSPPISLNPFWFKRHVAYTVAKYNMSLFALGLAAELRESGIAVNTIWPKTGRIFLSPLIHHVLFLAIDTDAITLIAGEDYRKKCRRPEIMADAAYAILTQDSRSCTGNFFVDEAFLRQQGVTDFDQYAVVPGTKDLMLDFFLDENMEELKRLESPMAKEKPQTNTASAASGGENVEQIFDKIKTLLSPDLLQKINSVYSFDLQG